MVAAQSHQQSISPVTVPLSPVAQSVVHVNERAAGAEAYFRLTGCDPFSAEIEQDQSFDRHVLASILAVAVTEGGSLAERAGLSVQDLTSLLLQWFPSAHGTLVAEIEPSGQDNHADDDEVAMVRDLLLEQRSRKDEVSGWLAAMIARRALEPNHLWEDLGLRERPELTRLLMRHFAPLAARNTKNMKWKRFFYRMLCEDDGFVMCTTPVCTNCNDFNLCFGDESGESRMADRRREVSLRMAEAAGAVLQSSVQE